MIYDKIKVIKFSLIKKFTDFVTKCRGLSK